MTGNALALQVLEALGIGHRNVTAVQIDMRAMEAATIQITRSVKVEEAQQIVNYLSAYRIELTEPIGERDEQPDE
ncbi:hypothetical protein [Pseudomonas oryzihabitans]|uniref:DUF2007 domain-containing protein n=1 Tax=Pseudomonas oryzihabitans TaxID=47885 RepID=A0ABX3IQP4_9PSED|nr:hypothetical protein [Pseudomonas psychrotolerans]ONN70670.1 hypothetical protein BVL52_20770 [Pseudomonas psychrotolerans]